MSSGERAGDVVTDSDGFCCVKHCGRDATLGITFKFNGFTMFLELDLCEQHYEQFQREADA